MNLSYVASFDHFDLFGCFEVGCLHLLLAAFLTLYILFLLFIRHFTVFSSFIVISFFIFIHGLHWLVRILEVLQDSYHKCQIYFYFVDSYKIYLE